MAKKKSHAMVLRADVVANRMRMPTVFWAVSPGPGAVVKGAARVSRVEPEAVAVMPTILAIRRPNVVVAVVKDKVKAKVKVKVSHAGNHVLAPAAVPTAAQQVELVVKRRVDAGAGQRAAARRKVPGCHVKGKDKGMGKGKGSDKMVAKTNAEVNINRVAKAVRADMLVVKIC